MCFLIHQWKNWNSELFYMNGYIGMFQKRHCKHCNKIQTRGVQGVLEMSTCIHSPYWIGHYGTCMVCRAEKAESALIEANTQLDACKVTIDALRVKKHELVSENIALRNICEELVEALKNSEYSMHRHAESLKEKCGCRDVLITVRKVLTKAQSLLSGSPCRQPEKCGSMCYGKCQADDASGGWKDK